MNDMVSTRPVGALATFEPPNLTPATELAVRQYLDHEANGNLRRFGVPSIPAHLRDRAAAYVARAELQGVPADFDTVLGWLTPLAASVAQAPSPGDFRAKAAAVQMACMDVPGWAFTAATSLAAVRRFKFFPAAAEVRELLMEETREHRGTVRALKAIAAAPAKPVDDAPMTAEQREAAAAGMRAAIADLKAKAATDAPGRPEAPIAKPLSAGHLAAIRAENPLIQAARRMQAEMADKGDGA